MMSKVDEYVRQWYPDEDDDDLLLLVRNKSRWDEEHFQRMMCTAKDLLEEMPHDRELVERWEYGFTEEIQMLINLMRHPGFLAACNDDTMPATTYREFIEERVKLLEGLRTQYEAIRAR